MTSLEPNMFQFFMAKNIVKIKKKTDEFNKDKKKKLLGWNQICQNSRIIGNFENDFPLAQLDIKF